MSATKTTPPLETVIRAENDDLDDILHVTDALYQQLEDRAHASRARSAMPETDPSLQRLAESVIFAEARMLDMRRFDDWLGMLTRDCIYWVPASPDPVDPRTSTSIHLDDRRRLRDRIALAKTGHLHAQRPPSRTCRVVTNVEVWRSDENQGQLVVRSNLTVSTYRLESMNAHVGWQEHVLVPASATNTYLIRFKTLNLLDCDGPQGNITFIL